MAKPTKKPTRFWISWYEPSEDPRPARDYKRAPEWWCTGYAYREVDGEEQTLTTICAVVDAKDQAAAERFVSKFWDPAEWRFCEEREAGWLPPADRFPRKEGA